MRYTTKKEFDTTIQLLTDKIKELEIKLDTKVVEKPVIKPKLKETFIKK